MLKGDGPSTGVSVSCSGIWNSLINHTQHPFYSQYAATADWLFDT